MILRVEGAVEIDRALLAAIGENDDIVEIHQRRHQPAKCVADGPIVHRHPVDQGCECLKKSIEVDTQIALPADFPASGYTPSTGQSGLKYLSWGIYRRGRL
ncbi:hypothetical protein [Sinorhizobium psoraleae]|uniref:Uncharacterized protein n=1 Tax=Sinorhizobium psoraleae TaxID=520838 RepID=A0ABT4KJG4_9HYPH|nr:hypothetical protein [Sinorhizobium psoraleae]MCZ4092088.1 hypothetical protein [Sinorhizobium psoraleae]